MNEPTKHTSGAIRAARFLIDCDEPDGMTREQAIEWASEQIDRETGLPDLLEACEAAIYFAEGAIEAPDAAEQCRTLLPAVMTKLLNAVAKAEGR